MNDLVNVFTLRVPGQVADIRSGIRVANPANKDVFIDTMAVWDTGSPLCFISKKVMLALGLKFESQLSGYGMFASGSTFFGTVSIRLVSSGRYYDVKAGVVDDLHRGPDCQVLIGMNLICKGQFSFAYYDNVSTVSFAIPAISGGDLVDEAVSGNVGTTFDYIDATEMSE